MSAFRIHLAAGRFTEAAALLAALQPTRETETYELALAQQQFAAATGGTAQEPAPQIRATPEQSTSERVLAVEVSPNPFNPETSIRFRLPATQQGRLVIYDLTGRVVRRLVDGEQTAGEHLIRWNGRDEQGQPAASGTYFAEIVFGSTRQVTKMLLIR